MKPNLVQVNLLVHVVRHTDDDFPPTELAAVFGQMFRDGLPQTIPLTKNATVALVGRKPGPDVTLHIAGIDVVAVEQKAEAPERNGSAP